MFFCACFEKVLPPTFPNPFACKGFSANPNGRNADEILNHRAKLARAGGRDFVTGSGCIRLHKSGTAPVVLCFLRLVDVHPADGRRGRREAGEVRETGTAAVLLFVRRPFGGGICGRGWCLRGMQGGRSFADAGGRDPAGNDRREILCGFGNGGGAFRDSARL